MVNTIFNFLDSGGNAIYSNIYISPAIAPINYSSNIITTDLIVALEDDAGVTVPLVPNTYNIRLVGNNTETSFLITLPSGIDGQTVSASNYITSTVPTGSFTASYALNALSASYAPSSNAATASWALNALTASYAQGTLRLFNAQTNLWYSLLVTGSLGNEYFAFTQP